MLSNRAVESFWDAMWLGIGPFLCFWPSAIKSFSHYSNLGALLRGLLAIRVKVVFMRSLGRPLSPNLGVLPGHKRDPLLRVPALSVNVIFQINVSAATLSSGGGDNLQVISE